MPSTRVTAHMQPGRAAADRKPRFTRTEFCKLSAELDHEFGMLDEAKTFIGTYQTAFGRSTGNTENDLEGAGQAIQNLNLMLGFDEAAGLTAIGVYP